MKIKQKIREQSSRRSTQYSRLYKNKSSKYKGVCVNKNTLHKQIYTAFLGIKGKTVYIAGVADEVKAAALYDAVAQRVLIDPDLNRDSFPEVREFDTSNPQFDLIVEAAVTKIEDIPAPNVQIKQKEHSILMPSKTGEFKIDAQILSIEKLSEKYKISKHAVVKYKTLYKIYKNKVLEYIYRESLDREKILSLLKTLGTVNALALYLNISTRKATLVVKYFNIKDIEYLPHKTCEMCKAPYKSRPGKSREQRFCSSKCSDKFWSKELSIRNDPKAYIRSCKTCTVLFCNIFPYKSNFCSEECKVLFDLSKVGNKLIKVKNLKRLIGQRKKRIKSSLYKLNRIFRKNTRTQKTCAHCGGFIYFKKGHHINSFCSKNCSKAHWTLTTFNRLPRGRKRRPQDAYRSYLKQVYRKGKPTKNEKFTVIERRLNLFGKHVCCFCNKKCDSPATLTIEHLIPYHRAKEKYNWLNNLFCACRSCNSNKSDRGWKKWFRNQTFYSKARELEIDSHLNNTADCIEVIKTKYKK